jgi:hypothetical protein
MGAAARRALWLRRSAEAIVGDEVWRMGYTSRWRRMAGGNVFKKLSAVELGTSSSKPHGRPNLLRMRCYTGSSLGIPSCEGNIRSAWYC